MQKWLIRRQFLYHFYGKRMVPQLSLPWKHFYLWDVLPWCFWVNCLLLNKLKILGWCWPELNLTRCHFILGVIFVYWSLWQIRFVDISISCHSGLQSLILLHQCVFHHHHAYLCEASICAILSLFVWVRNSRQTLLWNLSIYFNVAFLIHIA